MDTAKDASANERAQESDRTHTEIQGRLRDLGHALEYAVWIAANDRTRAYCDGRLCDGCLYTLPVDITFAPGADAGRLIDVLWLERNTDAPTTSRVVGALEVEHTASIFLGIVRMLDLALGAPAAALTHLFLVAPDDREADVRPLLARPAFSRVADLNVKFLPYGELERHRESMARFGAGIKAVEAVARRLV